MQQLFSPVTLCFLLLSPLWCLPSSFQTLQQLRSKKEIKYHLNNINKIPQKTIQSPDGDIIDCVLFHQQPAFDHPLSSHIQREPNERPKGSTSAGGVSQDFQLWSAGGEGCPLGTIPIRRAKEEDLLRTSSIGKFGRRRFVRRDSSAWGHEHAVAYANGDKYYGARASLNVWSPRVANNNEFSLSQLWLIAGSFGEDLNTIEVGWQVSPELYGDNFPRFFTYWTTDAYRVTGCYNLLCSGFVQTNNKIAVGAAISPTSSYNGSQFDITLLIWKDPKHGNWWLELGPDLVVGYWPAYLFTHLKDHASMVQFGGEVYNRGLSGKHTPTQMGSGHFPAEGFGKASYFRNLQYVDWDNSLVPISDMKLLADHATCYDVGGGSNRAWGNYFYYGGPGRNQKCT